MPIHFNRLPCAWRMWKKTQKTASTIFSITLHQSTFYCGTIHFGRLERSHICNIHGGANKKWWHLHICKRAVNVCMVCESTQFWCKWSLGGKKGDQNEKGVMTFLYRMPVKWLILYPWHSLNSMEIFLCCKTRFSKEVRSVFFQIKFHGFYRPTPRYPHDSQPRYAVCWTSPRKEKKNIGDFTTHWMRAEYLQADMIDGIADFSTIDLYRVRLGMKRTPLLSVVVICAEFIYILCTNVKCTAWHSI